MAGVRVEVGVEARRDRHALPPGRNEFQPQLSLSYSSGSGNGAFGLGWSLSIPGVSRQTSKGVPRYNDAQDTFIR